MDNTTERREKAIEALTDQFSQMLRQWAEEVADSDTITLEEMEQEVRVGLRSLGEQVLQGLVDLVGTGKRDKLVACPQCDESMAFVRYQGKWVQTLLGTIRPQRAYFHCAECHQGFVPLDHQLGLGADSLSGGLEEALCLLSAHMPFEEAVDKLERLILVEVDDNTIQRAVLRVGSELVAREERRVERAWQQAAPPTMEVHEPPERLYISVDGTKAHLQEGWKEVKVAAIYETETKLQPDGTTQIRAIHITYVVSFEDAQTFARHVYVEAVRRGLLQAQEVIVLGDGAEWIWKRIATFCEHPLEIVDFYHASEHVWAAGQALYGEGTPQTEQWVNKRLDELLERGPGTMLASFWRAAAEASSEPQSALIQEINYFTKCKQRMPYPELRAAGYHIGSGCVESACKRIIRGRLKQSGMIWSREGAQAMAQLRATILSNRWDQFWASYERSIRASRRAA